MGHRGMMDPIDLTQLRCCHLPNMIEFAYFNTVDDLLRCQKLRAERTTFYEAKWTFDSSDLIFES